MRPVGKWLVFFDHFEERPQFCSQFARVVGEFGKLAFQVHDSVISKSHNGICEFKDVIFSGHFVLRILFGGSTNVSLVLTALG